MPKQHAEAEGRPAYLQFVRSCGGKSDPIAAESRYDRLSGDAVMSLETSVANVIEASRHPSALRIANIWNLRYLRRYRSASTSSENAGEGWRRLG